jgi:hypothetical protein
VTPAHDEIAVLAMGVACLIVVLGWTAAVVLTIVFMRRRLRRLEAQGPREDNELRFLFYAASVFFWPAALGCTIVFMREPKSARTGFVCGVLGLVHVSAIVLLTCAGMFALAIYRPHWLP